MPSAAARTLMLRASTALSTCATYEADGSTSRTSLRIAYASGTSARDTCRCADAAMAARSARDGRTRRLLSTRSAAASRGSAHRRSPAAPPPPPPPPEALVFTAEPGRESLSSPSSGVRSACPSATRWMMPSTAGGGSPSPAARSRSSPRSRSTSACPAATCFIRVRGVGAGLVPAVPADEMCPRPPVRRRMSRPSSGGGESELGVSLAWRTYGVARGAYGAWRGWDSQGAARRYTQGVHGGCSVATHHVARRTV